MTWFNWKRVPGGLTLNTGDTVTLFEHREDGTARVLNQLEAERPYHITDTVMFKGKIKGRDAIGGAFVEAKKS